MRSIRASGVGPGLAGRKGSEVSRTVIVLAAGQGKRMKSALPKVLHPLLGRTLLDHVLGAARPLAARRTLVVVGHGADEVTAHLAETDPTAEPVLQREQRGTGHAVRTATERCPELSGTVIVLGGDAPMLRPQSLFDLVETHERTGAAATVLTAQVPNPTGLGRIIRHPRTGELDAIVEERDATPAQRAINEINSGVYAFDGELLVAALEKLTTNNDQGEELLTDVISLLNSAGRLVSAMTVPDPTEVLGCNDRAELAGLRALLRDRINTAWMRAGVTIIDPATTWIDATVTLSPDVVIEPNTHLRGATRVESAAVIGPDTTLIDVYAGAGAQVLRTHAIGATIGARANVGPFAYLRPGSVLHERAKVGTFVEVKNSELGAGAKVPHLSYVGDATIGARANIGAATIFVNYDGVNKHHTTVGEAAFIGCDTCLIAPVEVEPGAYVGAGSVISSAVPSGALAVTRSPQRNVAGWVERKRPGTVSAQAAAAVRGEKDHPGRDADGEPHPGASDTGTV